MSSELIRVFFEAVKVNQVDTVADLIRSGSVSVDEVDKTHMNMTAMHYAAELGYSELITVLLTFKPNLLKTDDIGYVPLTLAVDSDNFQIVKKLIEIDPDNIYIEDIRQSNPQFFDENGEFVGMK